MISKISLKVMVKAGIIGVLFLLLLIPMIFVNGLIKGRLRYKEEAVGKITSSWGGGSLDIAAPLLNIPYTYTTQEKDGKETVVRTHNAIRTFTPSALDVKAELIPQTRYIGIFKVPVFTAKLKMSGSFKDIPAVAGKKGREFVSFEINGLSGISSTPALKWGGKNLEFEPSSNEGEFLSKSITSYIPDAEGEIPFEIMVDIKGSGSIAFAPVAKQNRFEIVSPWTTPNFSGSFLPDTKEVAADGFKAVWNINYIASGIPSEISRVYFGDAYLKTSLLFPVDNYRQAERAVKYAALFIALTFLTCFVFEVARSKPVHPFQYILIGVAMAVFYVLLVSVSEFISFGGAYLTAAGATVLLITVYARFTIIKKRAPKQVLGACAILTFLYGYLYMLLQLQDLSLIFGAIGLFGGVAAVMYATRNIQWYEEENEK